MSKVVQISAVLGVLFLGHSAYGQGAAGQAAKPSRWSVSAGAMIRSIEADMHVPAPGNWRNYVRTRGASGMGDRGLFTAGENGFPILAIDPAVLYVGPGTDYEDGNVGILSGSVNFNGLDPIDADLVVSGALAIFDSMDQFDVYFDFPVQIPDGEGTQEIDILLGQVNYHS